MSVISVKLNIDVSKLANEPGEDGNMDGKRLHSNGPNYALAGLRCTRTPPVTNNSLVSGAGYGSLSQLLICEMRLTHGNGGKKG